MVNFLLTGGTIVSSEKIIENGYLLINKDKIAQVGSAKDSGFAQSNLENLQVLSVSKDILILPGFIDMHLHGVLGADVMDGTEEALTTISKALPREGVTSFLATTMTESSEAITKALSNAAAYMEKDHVGAELLGLNLEGPFISHKKAGAQALSQIKPPSLKLIEQWNRQAKGKLSLVTLAPEEEGALALINALTQQGIIASVGHSEASFKETADAIANGLTHATHLYNAMPTLHHREPGVVGAVLLNERVKAEVIFDGIHVSEEMVELAYRVKGSKGLVLITDSIRAKGLGDGEYELGGQKVFVENGVPKLGNKTLAGSVLEMNQAVKRAYKLVQGNLFELVDLSSLNAAKQLGISDRKGCLAPGMDADIVVLDMNFQVKLTVCRGKISYNRD